jgi:hypothetical protein
MAEMNRVERAAQDAHRNADRFFAH